MQSRYYNPELCRFISADDFSCLDTSNKLSANAYAYCWNCPVSFHDVQGTTPELSINLADVISFIQNINNRLKNDITEGIARLKEKLNKFESNFKNALKTRYNAFIDKMEYCLNYPDAVINSVLSKLFNTDVNIRFRFIEFLREKANVKFDLSKLKVDVDGNGSTKTQAARKFKKTSNAGDVVAVVITEIFVCLDLQEIAKKLKIDLVFNDLFDYMQKKTNTYRQYFDSVVSTAAKSFASDISGFLSTILGWMPKLSIETTASLKVLPYIIDLLNDYSGRYITPMGAFIMAMFDIVIRGIIDVGGAALEVLGLAWIGSLFTNFAGYIYGVDNIRNKAEYISYNWYYLLFVDWSKI